MSLLQHHHHHHHQHHNDLSFNSYVKDLRRGSISQASTSKLYKFSRGGMSGKEQRSVFQR